MKEPVKVLFEFDGKSETVGIVGRPIEVKAAIMTILSKLADYDEITACYPHRGILELSTNHAIR